MYLIFLINLYCSFFYRKKHMVLTNFQSLQKDQRWRTIRYLLHSYSFETLHLLFNGNRSVVVLLTRTTKFGFSQPKLFCSMYKHMTVCKQCSSSCVKLIFCSDIFKHAAFDQNNTHYQLYIIIWYCLILAFYFYGFYWANFWSKITLTISSI